jgi:hypothetical protein
MMSKLVFVAALATSLTAGFPASVLAANENTGVPHGGADIGPNGQCFNPPDCGGKHSATAANASQCSLVRERVVSASGHVTFRRHRVCE